MNAKIKSLFTTRNVIIGAAVIGAVAGVAVYFLTKNDSYSVANVSSDLVSGAEAASEAVKATVEATVETVQN